MNWKQFFYLKPVLTFYLSGNHAYCFVVLRNEATLH